MITNTLISICVFNLVINMHLIQLWSRSFVLSIINEKLTKFINLKICTCIRINVPFSRILVKFASFLFCLNCYATDISVQSYLCILISLKMFTIKKLPKNLSKNLKLLKNKYPKTCSTLSRWQAGEFHFGSACLSIYLKLSNSNYIHIPDNR